MFQKLSIIEPVNLEPDAEAGLSRYAKQIVSFPDLPGDNAEIIRRIGDADAVLVSYTTNIEREVIEACPNIRYIGMCCSLYSPESANVDIRAAEEHGITVLGIRDYGDEGVLEYAISELVRLLHGFGGRQWKKYPAELTGQKIGIIGMGTTGKLLAKGFRFFGAEVSYYSRTRKPEEEAKGVVYLPLPELLQQQEIICTCLNKNTILLHEAEFQQIGNGKILMNTSISPSYDLPALKAWLSCPENYYFCDTLMALGDPSGELLSYPNVFCMKQSAGYSMQSRGRLGKKVLQNIEYFLSQQNS